MRNMLDKWLKSIGVQSFVWLAAVLVPLQAMPRLTCGCANTDALTSAANSSASHNCCTSSVNANESCCGSGHQLASRSCCASASEEFGSDVPIEQDANFDASSSCSCETRCHCAEPTDASSQPAPLPSPSVSQEQIACPQMIAAQVAVCDSADRNLAPHLLDHPFAKSAHDRCVDLSRLLL